MSHVSGATSRGITAVFAMTFSQMRNPIAEITQSVQEGANCQLKIVYFGAKSTSAPDIGKVLLQCIVHIAKRFIQNIRFMPKDVSESPLVRKLAKSYGSY